MQPILQLKTKTDFYQFLWLTSVTGFDARTHCMPCLKGVRSGLISKQKGFPAGFIAEGTIENAEPFLYLCGVSAFSRYYPQHLHLLLVPDADSTVEYEDENVIVTVGGVRRLPIEPVPGADLALPKDVWSCRNWQAAWHLFPADRLPFPPAAGENPSGRTSVLQV